MDMQRIIASFPVREILSETVTLESFATEIDRGGIELTRSSAAAPAARFVWLEFALPDAPEKRMRALGEYVDEQRIRFKHLFPDHRVRLERYLAAHAERRAA